MLPDFRVRQRDYLLEITRAITEELNQDKLLARILNIAIEMLAGQAGLIALRESQGGWRIAASHGIPPAFLRHLDPLLAAVPEHEEPARYELPEINRLLQSLTRKASWGLLAGVVLPLTVRKQVVGIILIFRNYQGSFSANDTALLQSFADQAAIAVRNAQLYSQVSREKRQMDGLLESAADGILLMNASNQIEVCNPAFAHMLGVTPQKLLGKNHSDVLRLRQPKDGMTLEQAEAGGWPLTPNAALYVEGDLIRDNGLPLPVGITYAPLLDPDDSLVDIVATVRDITRYREAEELKSTFVSVVSHELKTPVALIKGYVSTLRREDVRWEQDIVQDSLKVIEEEADHLTELIENLLDASRLQAGALSIHLTDLDLRHLTERVCERMRTQSGNHTIEVDFSADFPIILGDEDRLAQVLNNMISNAIKYSPEGGKVTVSGRARREQVILCVSDEGPGISPGDIPHIFDRFYRSSETARTTKGTGLGLYLSRAIVEAHGGRIWADPKPGSGARICFSLPRREEQ